MKYNWGMCLIIPVIDNCSNSARTKYYLRQKWAALKRSFPCYQFRTYQGEGGREMLCCVDSFVLCLDCLEYLLEHRLRILKEQCLEKFKNIID